MSPLAWIIVGLLLAFNMTIALVALVIWRCPRTKRGPSITGLTGRVVSWTPGAKP